MSTNGDKIAKILEDPESIKMISEIAQSFLEGSNQKNEPKEETKNDISGKMKEEISVPQIIATTNGISKLFSESDIENTIRLISALKPYINSNRQSNAEYILKILNMIKFISKYNLSELGGVMNLFM